MKTHLLLLAACLAGPFLLQAQTFSVLHNFSGSDGSFPLGGLLLSANGTFYGTTDSGGSSGTGTIYSLQKQGPGQFPESVIYNLTGLAGQGPSSSLISVNGTLIGTAAEGGHLNGGTVFQLTPGVNGGPWTETTLYTFESSPDGHGPEAGLTLGSGGVLFGTTPYGGNLGCINSLGCGTVYQLAPPAVQGGPWTESIIYKFLPSGDGINPIAGVTLGSNGDLYGVTTSGGSFGAGAVYQLAPPAIAGNAWTETIIYNFHSGSDGEEPTAGLTFNTAGDLFGSTLGGGTFGCGTIFALTPPAVAGNAWNKFTIHSFNCSDGAYPQGALLYRGSGSSYLLYGTASGGGASNAGSIFVMIPPGKAGQAWKEYTLHSFNPATDGSTPNAGLIAGANGGLLGTASTGGANNLGTVFTIFP